MNRKEKKELRQRQSTRQLMGIDGLTEHGMKTARGELVYYLIKPDNLSVMSRDGVQGRVLALTNLLTGVNEMILLAMDSRESFQRNKDYYQKRLAEEELPALRELLRQDMAHLDEIQAATASAREFALVIRLDKQAAEDHGLLSQMEKIIRDNGFHVRLADAQDIKRLLAVYYQQDVTTEVFENYDGERVVIERG